MQEAKNTRRQDRERKLCVIFMYAWCEILRWLKRNCTEGKQTGKEKEEFYMYFVMTRVKKA